jgi:hypothetical protein
MMKACDRVEWPFIEAMLLKLGFPVRLVQSLMRCVSTAQFSVKVNGALLEQFQPSRGLRQGDPVSPYLFLACAEGLTALLHHYNSHLDRGVRVCNRAPWVSHLLFADDSLIFINANSVSARRLDEILQIYNNASGQRVNKAKSVVFFSPCTPADQRTEVKQILDIHVEAFTENTLVCLQRLGV